MLRGAKDYFSPITDSVNKLKKYLSDRVLITDLTAKLIITFGVILIVGGFYLMLTDAGASAQAAQTILAVNSVVSTVNWVPGIPFYIGALTNLSVSTIGLVSWLIGLDLLLVGLGLWVRHSLARYTALAIFLLAAVFQFVQFLYLGVVGAPASVAVLCIDVAFFYFLFARFDSQKAPPKQVADKFSTG